MTASLKLRPIYKIRLDLFQLLLQFLIILICESYSSKLEGADGVNTRFEVLFARPEFAALPAFPFCSCLGEIHWYSCAAEGSGGIWMHRGKAVPSQGGCSWRLCLGRGGISGSGCEEPVGASAFSGSDVFQHVISADESLFPLAQVVNFKKPGLSSFDKFHNFVEDSIPYNMD